MKNNEIEYVDCNFCQSSEKTSYYQDDNWKIVKCLDCGFIYTNPRPTEDSLASYYEESYYKDQRHVNKFYNKDGTVKIGETSYTNRIEDVEKYVERRGELLEIGCARGEFLHILKKRGWSVSGVEISEDAVNLGKKLYDIDLFCGTIHDFHSDKKFDVICLYQTLEHLPSPKRVIEKCKTLLKKGGVLIIEVPNARSFDMKLSKERRILSYDLPRHLNHFYPKFLNKQMISMGFHVKEINDYYPKFLIDLITFKNSFKKDTKGNSTIGSKGNNQRTSVPLLKTKDSLFKKVFNFIAKRFPGWRFTIYAVNT